MLINSNKNMTLKTYQKVRLLITFVLAMLISQLITKESYLWPILLVIVASLVLWFLRGRVKEVIADERDYYLGGKAALLAIQIFGWLGVLTMFLLYYLKQMNPNFEIIASTLSFSILGLFFLYAIIFKIYNKIKK